MKSIWLRAVPLKMICFAACGLSPDAPTSPEKECRDEICDGLDNDCDGLVDYFITDGKEVSACHSDCVMTSIPLNIVRPGRSIGNEEPSCVSTDGFLELSYGFDCSSTNSPWATCQYASGVDLEAFDRDNGYLAVELEVFGVVTRGLNFWYGPHPDRRLLRLKYPDVPLPPGRYVRYFSASESCTDDTRMQCPWCANNSACPFEDGLMRLADITIAAEDCRIDRAEGRVRLLSVTHFSNGCTCTRAAHCAPPFSSCRVVPEKLLPDQRCNPPGSSCAGLCSL